MTLKSSVYPKISGFVSVVAVFAIVAERSASFAASQENLQKENLQKSKQTMEEEKLAQFDSVKTLKQACDTLEGKILTYYDTTAYIQNCKQLVIEDPEILNELIYVGKKEVFEVPARLYRMIPNGKSFGRKEMARLLYKPGFGKEDKIPCSEIEGKYITDTGTQYYLVDKCLKREFVSYSDLQSHNQGLTHIVSLTPEQLARIPRGKGMIVKPSEEAKILSKMDGGVEWSLLARSRKQADLPSDTPEKLQQVNKASTQKVLGSDVCKEFEGKVVAFYSQIFWMSKCKLRTIEGYSIQLQEKIQSLGGVSDLTPEQIKVVAKGKSISDEELIGQLKE